MPSLTGVRVLDLSRVLAGPYCTMMLGDLGAEVIKVERPGSGDDTRGWGPPFVAGESAYYLCCNRNKSSVAINLKSPAGQDLVASLAAGADIVVENFLPGQLAAFGLDADTLCARHPRLVYCSITGFGQTGPRRDEPGYDIMIQARAGVMSITGDAAGPPQKLGVAIADITSGMYACQAILAALYAREKTGRGDRIDIALYDSTLAWLANIGQNYLVSGEVPRRQGSAHPNIVPYQQFSGSSGTFILAVGNDAQFARFAQLAGHPEWSADERFRTNKGRVAHRETLLPQIAAALQTRTADEWLALCLANDVPAGPVQTIDAALADPQVAARGMLGEVAHPTIGPLQLIASPLHFTNNPVARMRPPPRLGEQTDEVLSRLLSLEPAKIARLRAEGAIG